MHYRRKRARASMARALSAADYSHSPLFLFARIRAVGVVVSVVVVVGVCVTVIFGSGLGGIVVVVLDDTIVLRCCRRPLGQVARGRQADVVSSCADDPLQRRVSRPDFVSASAS